MWFTTYWRCIDKCGQIKFGSVEFCINLDTGRCSSFHDDWDFEGRGWCNPGELNRWRAYSNIPWTGNPGGFPELEALAMLK